MLQRERKRKHLLSFTRFLKDDVTIFIPCKHLCRFITVDGVVPTLDGPSNRADHWIRGGPTLRALGQCTPLGFEKLTDFQWAAGPCPRPPNTFDPFPFLFLKLQILSNSKGTCSMKS
ncbi:hypothetical protein AAC387_Pa03g1011 [Persea americana]